MRKIIFIEGLPNVGKTYLINKIRNLNMKNVFIVDEIINPIIPPINTGNNIDFI